MTRPARPHWSESIDATRYLDSGRRVRGLHINPAVFVTASVITLAVIVATIARSSASAALFESVRVGIITHFDGFLMAAGDLFLVFCIALIVSPYGSIRLGGPDDRPEYSTTAWFAMLLGAGMGIGLVFYGVAEPVTHFTTSLAANAAGATSGAPLGGAPGDPATARNLAMAAAIFNWSLHPWAIYAVIGLSLAIFTYRFDMPLSIRSTLYPVFGKAVWGRLGDAIDILVVFATLGGLITSLGLGAKQAMAGVSFLYDIPASAMTMIGLVAVMALFTFLSIWGGIKTGIRIMCEVHLWLAIALLAFVLLFGPTVLLLKSFFINGFDYLAYLAPLSNPVGRSDTSFFDDWSAYYWAWWISWAPFVGMFMARISRGRTVRGFLLGALVAPTLLSVAWMTIYGNTAIHQIMSNAPFSQAIIHAAVESKLFLMLEGLPWSSITCFLSVILILIFFITGWASGTVVIDTMTSGGKTDTPLVQRVFWLLAVGTAAVVLLLAGGLVAVETAAVTTGLPIAAIMLVICVSTWRALRTLRGRSHGQPSVAVAS